MKKLLFSILLLVTVLACDDPFLDSTYIDPTELENEMSCATVLDNHAEEFSLWIELLKYADYYNALNDAATTATVFCPTNQAMHEFLAWAGVETVSQLDEQYAKAVAQVHIIASDVTDETLLSYAEKGTSIPQQTIFGSYLTLGYGYSITDVDDAERDGKIFNTDSIYFNNQARLQKFTAVKTANGELFTMGSVIRPLSETMIDKLETYGEYSIFVEAARRSGYDKVASVCTDTIYNIDGTYSVNSHRFTCMAVPDVAFQAAGINSVDDLISKLDDQSDSALYNYVAYHFLSRSYSIEDLFAFEEEGQILIYDTELSHQVITVQETSGVKLFNGIAKILRSDVEARNGVIHKIDNYLPVYNPEPVTVIWDFCNYSDIESFVNAYGVSKNLGDLFSTEIGSKEYFIDMSEDKRDGNFGTVTSFTYKANASKSPYSNWRKAGFMKCNWLSTREKEVNKYGAYMDNLFTINLGYAGWIQFETPTIIKGKYRIEFYYATSVAMKSFYSGGSLTKFNLDDYQSSIYLWKGLPENFGSGVTGNVLWAEIEFEYSGSHTFKATMMDINAKTGSTYRQMWDYVKFVPID